MLNVSFHQSLLKASSLLLISLSAQALPFSIGTIEGDFNTELSLKNEWATNKPDHYYIGKNNGGRGLATTNDNNRKNFKRGDSFSRLLRGKHSILLKYQNSGLLVSGQYWYDFIEKNQRQSFANISDKGRYTESRSAGAEWQQVYAFHHYEIAGKQGTVKLGRQYLSWGEERFINGGINIINPQDNRWGWQSNMDTRAESLPVNLISFSQQMSDNLSTDFFYQLDWHPDATANCGSFFATNDYTTHGCNDLRVLQSNSQLSPVELSALKGVNINNEGTRINRGKDKRAKTSGQFGIALNYFLTPINADVGFYFINYHSRSGFTNGQSASQQIINQASTLGNLAPYLLAGHSSYFLKYPENIRLYGISFSKAINGNTTWRGELSYRPNMPVQISPIELFNQLTSTIIPQEIKGYHRKPVSQFQTSLTQTANEIMGADTFQLTTALGMNYVGDLNNRTLYGREAVFGNAANCAEKTNFCEKDGFTSRFSWGYRLQGEWVYNDVWLPRLSLQPNISWLHDVQGYSPMNEGTFIEGRKVITLGLKAEYLKTYYAAINYTNFFGGRYNLWSDRDYASLEAGLKF